MHLGVVAVNNRENCKKRERSYFIGATLVMNPRSDLLLETSMTLKIQSKLS